MDVEGEVAAMLARAGEPAPASMRELVLALGLELVVMTRPGLPGGARYAPDACAVFVSPWLTPEIEARAIARELVRWWGGIDAIAARSALEERL